MLSPEEQVKWMKLALALAEKGKGKTSPNPMVGALIVDARGQVLGEGYHHGAGQPHAEIEALEDARKKGLNPKGASMVVSLEPCRHRGRTGPCTEAIIASGIQNLVFAESDPNPIAGGGQAVLREAGLQVVSGVLEAEAKHLNRVFGHWVRTKRPYVTLKLATSLDGHISMRQGMETRITSEVARERVMTLRAEHDLVMVGKGTALADAPRLNVRLPSGEPAEHQPRRAILDSQLEGYEEHAYSLPHSLIVTTLAPSHPRVQALRKKQVEVLSVEARNGRVAILPMLETMAKMDPPICSVFLEGGQKLASSFIEEELVDEFILHLAPTLLGKAAYPAMGNLSKQHFLKRKEVRLLGEDIELSFGFEKQET